MLPAFVISFLAGCVGMKSNSKIQRLFRAFEKDIVLGAVVGVPDEKERGREWPLEINRGFSTIDRVDVPFLMDLPLARHFPADATDDGRRRRKYGTSISILDFRLYSNIVLDDATQKPHEP